MRISIVPLFTHAFSPIFTIIHRFLYFVKFILEFTHVFLLNLLYLHLISRLSWRTIFPFSFLVTSSDCGYQLDCGKKHLFAFDVDSHWHVGCSRDVGLTLRFLGVVQCEVCISFILFFVEKENGFRSWIVNPNVKSCLH